MKIHAEQQIDVLLGKSDDGHCATNTELYYVALSFLIFLRAIFFNLLKN